MPSFAARQHPGDPMVWVTPDGRVFRRVNQTHPERRQWREYKHGRDKDGYHVIRLNDRNTRVHRLVYLVYVGELTEGMVVCHLDGNKDNNHWSNLKQATQLENISHKLAHGTILSGERHPRCLYSDQQLDAVRQALRTVRRSKSGRVARGEVSRIAAQTGVGLHTIHDISRRGKNG